MNLTRRMFLKFIGLAGATLSIDASILLVPERRIISIPSVVMVSTWRVEHWKNGNMVEFFMGENNIVDNGFNHVITFDRPIQCTEDTEIKVFQWRAL